MRVVIDANIIMAMLIKPGKPVDLFFSADLEIFAPEFLFQELEKHRQLIMERSSLPNENVSQFLKILQKKIAIVPKEEFMSQSESAQKICPDPDDVPYFALALHLKCPLWTNEKRLKEQSNVIVYHTHELITLIRS